MKKATDLMQFYEKTITRKKISEKKATVAGSYLPLSVYKKLGYNTKKIKKYCTDTKTSWLGKLYRVNVETQENNTIDQKINAAIATSKLDETTPTAKAKAKRNTTPSSTSGNSNAADKAAERAARAEATNKNTRQQSCCCSRAEEGEPFAICN